MNLNYKLEVNKDVSKISFIRIGGTVPLYFEIYNTRGLIEVLEMIERFKTPYYIVGGCSKILFPDEFPKMALIHLSMNQIIEKEDYVEADAGVKLTNFANYMSNHNYIGFSGLVGIPGEIGGSVMNNAGAFSDELGKNITYIDVLEDGKLKRLTKDNVWFSYRFCSLKLRKVIILRVGFKKIIGDKTKLLAHVKECAKKRKITQPRGVLTLGSTFKNPLNISIAKTLDELGAKGLKIDDAIVSEVHANFIVNIKQSTQKNVLNIIDILCNKLYNKLGIIPELEIIILRW